MKRQITCLLAVCMLSALLCGCGRSEKQTAGTKPTAPVQTAAATEAPEPQTLGDIPDVDDIVRCYKELSSTAITGWSMTAPRRCRAALTASANGIR